MRKSPCALSIPPSTVCPETFGRAALKRWYTRTCSLRLARPDDHPSAGGLLHHLLTLTSVLPSDTPSTANGCRQARMEDETQAVIFFCLTLLSPIASIFGSGVPCAARTFLPQPFGCRRQSRDTAFCPQRYNFFQYGRLTSIIIIPNNTPATDLRRSRGKRSRSVYPHRPQEHPMLHSIPKHDIFRPARFTCRRLACRFVLPQSAASATGHPSIRTTTRRYRPIAS